MYVCTLKKTGALCSVYSTLCTKDCWDTGLPRVESATRARTRKGGKLAGQWNKPQKLQRGECAFYLRNNNSRELTARVPAALQLSHRAGYCDTAVRRKRPLFPSQGKPTLPLFTRLSRHAGGALPTRPARALPFLSILPPLTLSFPIFPNKLPFFP